MQRMTGTLLIPMVLWFGWTLSSIATYGQEYANTFFAEPMNALLAIMFIIVMTNHADIGIKAICDDYIHDKGWRYCCSILLYLIKIASCLAGIFAIASTHFHILTP